MDNDIKDRIYGTILGSACANSIAGSFIGLTHKEIVAVVGSSGVRDFLPGHAQSFLPGYRPGALLADSLMALELGESLVAHKGKYEESDLKQRYKHLLESDEFLEAAPGVPCLASLRCMVDNLDPAQCSATGAASHDSGAVRAYPIGCLPDASDRVQIAVAQAKLSHTDSRVWAAAAVLADSVHTFIGGHRLDSELSVKFFVEKEAELAKSIDDRFYDSWYDVAPDLDYENPATQLPYSLINVESSVDEAVPTAVGIFLIFRHSFADAVSQAAIAGGDTDTTAAVVGALAGSYLGAGAIPQKWLDNLAHRDRLEKLAEGLISLWK